MNPVISLVLLVTTVFFQVNGHGRLLEPTSRSSMWRFQRFSEYSPPVNYNDNELFCGGVDVQYGQNGGKCGECGDSWELPKPRPNENGGQFGRGVIARTYTAGEIFTAEVELTASHSGFFEFRLCEHNNLKEPEDESCFQHLLELADGSGTKYHVIDGSPQPHQMKLQLPQNVVCSQCILQWHYHTGNSWGLCPNGTGAVGCGPQEIFRACADIAIA